MYIWSVISNAVTECYELFIKPGTRGVVLRHKGNPDYSAYIEIDEVDKWAEQPFANLQEAKSWCEAELHQPSAPAAGYYVFVRQAEGDTEEDFCFRRTGQPFNRYEDAARWCQAEGYQPENTRLFLMLNRVPERFYEPRLASGWLRFDF
jgi:hypothetical protein